MEYQAGKYPEIDQLLYAITQLEVSIEVVPATAELKALGFCRLDFKCSKFSCTLSVDDEYGDGRAESHPALLLHLLLRGCDAYLEAEDYLVWCRHHSIDITSGLAREIYFELRANVPHLLLLFAPDIETVSGWDYELAAGMTQTLRAMKIPDSPGD